MFFVIVTKDFLRSFVLRSGSQLQIPQNGLSSADYIKIVACKILNDTRQNEINMGKRNKESALVSKRA